MPKETNPCLFDSSEDELSEDSNVLNVQNDYAKKYNDWRRKEELQKLKDKYGDNLDIMSEIEDNEDEDDDNSGGESEEEVDEDSDEESDSNESIDQDPFDDDFLKMYSALKSKDPKIYDKSFKFFDSKVKDDNEKTKINKIKPVESKKLTLPEYHRKLIEEKKGITEEDENMMNDLDNEAGTDDNNSGYYEELYDIRNEIKNIVGQTNIDDDVDSDDLFSVKVNPHSTKPIQTTKQNGKDNFISKIWDKSKKLDKNDEFLKDFVVNRRYCDSDKLLKEEIKKYTNVDGHFGGFNNSFNTDTDDFPDEKAETSKSLAKNNIEIAKYHFEEPDANLIKRYPRAINSIRDTVKEKKSKRAEIRERKKAEKEVELKRLRKLKREETESKLQKLKKVSGNQSINIKDLDLNVIIDDEKDFEPEKYDEKMKLLFGESYYNVDDDKSKPQFDYIPEIDDDLNVDINVDDLGDSKNELTKNKKKNKKEIKQKRDIMADDDIGIYEDLIGGEVATRFLYRMVEPNDFGLTDEEIMLADDKELNQWCSLKKMSQYRSKDAELYDKKVYSQKAANMELKKKILKSIYGNIANNNDQTEEAEADTNVSDHDSLEQIAQKLQKRGKKRRAKKNKTKPIDNSTGELEVVDDNPEKVDTLPSVSSNNIAKSKKRKRKSKLNGHQTDVDLERLKAYGISNKEIKKLKNKL